MKETDKNLVEKKLIQARLSLIERQPFLGSLSMRITAELDSNIPFACCNGITVKFNPEKVNELTMNELVYLYAHEILHVAFEHSLRLQGRDPLGFNIYCRNRITSSLFACISFFIFL